MVRSHHPWYLLLLLLRDVGGGGGGTMMWGYALAWGVKLVWVLFLIFVAVCMMFTMRIVHSTIRIVNTTYTAAVKTTTHPKTRCRKPYAATQHLMFLMMGIKLAFHSIPNSFVILAPLMPTSVLKQFIHCTQGNKS